MNDYKFREQVNKFVTLLSTEHLHIIPTQIECYKHPFSFTFETTIIVDDKYIMNPVNTGLSSTLNENFYKDADIFGIDLFGEKPSWNNTRHVGWFIVKD